MKVIDASMGFTCTLWRVAGPGLTCLVYACDNYTAAAAAGFKFSQCTVTACASGGVA